MVTLRDGTAPRGAPVRDWLLAARFPRPQRLSQRYRRGHPARCARAVASRHGCLPAGARGHAGQRHQPARMRRERGMSTSTVARDQAATGRAGDDAARRGGCGRAQHWRRRLPGAGVPRHRRGFRSRAVPLRRASVWRPVTEFRAHGGISLGCHPRMKTRRVPPGGTANAHAGRAHNPTPAFGHHSLTSKDTPD